ncbi:MAG TPA: carboxypeptidase-like regulatory domain-containing protein [Thermoanaerobaculia bacterium]|jgi:hypothetical protein
MNIRTKAAIAALFFALAVAPVKATEVSVAFTRRGAAPAPAAPAAEVLLRLVPAAASGAERIERRVNPASPALFDLAGGHWELQVESEAWWHAPQFFFVDAKPAAAAAGATPAPVVVDVELWPAGIVTGTIALKDSRTPPADLRMRFQSAADPPQLPSHEVFCSVAETRYRCVVPLGQVDLRLRAPGYLPRYYWDTAVTAAAPANLGAAVLEKGASLTGTVLVGSGVELTPRERETIQVVANPADADIPPHAAGLGRYVARAGKRGHFNLDGLPPGDYVIRAAVGKHISDDVHVVVIAGSVAELREPLRLETPSSLRVAVTPPLDPWNERWRVTLKRTAAGGEHELAARTPATEAGEWISPPLRSGQYTVEIGSHQGGVWASRELPLPGESNDVLIALPAIKVTGTVTLGDRALPSTVKFEREDFRSIELTADREGKFDGYLPERDGVKWKVVVTSGDPYVRHTFHDVEPKRGVESAEATLDLDIPFTTLSGYVIDEEGKAAEGIVNVTSPEERLVQINVGEDGYFVVHGLEPALYRVQAVVFLGESEVVQAKVTDDLAPDPLRLVVRSQQKIEGRVGSDAAPVPGAEVLVIATDVPQQLIMPAETNFRGEFGAVAPRAARELDVIVGAPGFDVRMFRQRAPTGPLQIRVTQHGGRLVIPLASNDLEPYLQHAGATEFLGEHIRGMQAQIRGGAGGAPRQLVLGPLEPGPYSLCLIRHIEAPLLRAGLVDRNERCSEGYLPPHGELIFATPRVIKQ